MTASRAPMMAAMMLPDAVPAIARRAREREGVLTAPLFAASYLIVWTAAGLAIDALYRPPVTGSPWGSSPWPSCTSSHR